MKTPRCSVVGIDLSSSCQLGRELRSGKPHLSKLPRNAEYVVSLIFPSCKTKATFRRLFKSAQGLLGRRGVGAVITENPKVLEWVLESLNPSATCRFTDRRLSPRELKSMGVVPFVPTRGEVASL